MSDPLFDFVDIRAGRIRHDAAMLATAIGSLTAVRDYELRPAAHLRDAASILREAADELEAIADKAPKPIKENA